jgi:iron complex transport system ATP-binding protein
MYFVIADPADDQRSWLPARLLYDPLSSPLDEIVDSAAARLGRCERRVAVSLFFQGYAARLISPQLGCLVRGGCVPAVPARRLCWRRPDGELIELGLIQGQGWRGPVDALLRLVVTQSFAEHLDPLAATLLAHTRLSPAVLVDNVASALISAHCLTDDSLGADWRSLASTALTHPLLSGSGHIGAGEPAFVRRSCCLYYRVTNGGKCGDCPLA